MALLDHGSGVARKRRMAYSCVKRLFLPSINLTAMEALMFKEVLPGSLLEGSPCRRETHEERRNQRRLKICRPVHIRVLNDSESATTLDIARQGLCFVTSRDHYHPGMSLFLTFLSSSYSSPSFA